MPQSQPTFLFNNTRTSRAGLNTAFNLTAATVIKATPGRVARLIIQAAGTTGGSFTINDCATTGAAAIGNQLYTVAFGSASVGTPIELDLNCKVGITLSAVPSAGSPIAVITYD